MIKKSVFQKHKAKSTTPAKQSVFSQKQSVVYTSLQNIKIEFKELRDRENAHRDLYWFTLNPKLHPVFSETTEEHHQAIKPRLLTTQPRK